MLYEYIVKLNILNGIYVCHNDKKEGHTMRGSYVLGEQKDCFLGIHAWHDHMELSFFFLIAALRT